MKSADGLGQKLFLSQEPVTRSMDSVDLPAALVQVATDKGPIGEWIVSSWFTRYPVYTNLDAELGGIMPNVKVEAPQTFSFNGRTYEIALRPTRYYNPYSIKLVAFNHDLYPGTDIPKNFSSMIHLTDPTTGDDRDIKIYMNSPLRYHGATYYQASFEPGDRVSILQVVRNPASLAPYIACSLVALGLVIQFLMHLFAFARRRAQPTKLPPPRKTPAAPVLEPVLANGKGRHL